jgi:MoaA/NifB/PqqE/SkfB family radical SAM enzyme
MKLAPIALRGYHWQQTVLEATPGDGIFYLAMNMTSACNYRCPYCFVGLANLKRSADEITLAQKKRVIQEGAACGARVLSMPGRGEPLMDEHFWELLSEANNLGLYVVVYTNGYALDAQKINRLKDANVSLYVKVDSFDRDVYETMVGRRGVFDQMRRNLDLIVDQFHRPVEEDGRLMSRFGINSVVSVQSASSIPILDAWCEERKVFYTCRSPVKVGEAELTWDYLVKNQVLELRAIGQKYATRNFTSATEQGQCGIYRFGITVENNGEIYVCPDARTGFGRIGNVKETPLRDLIVRRSQLYPLNSSRGFCFVKAHLNPEENVKESVVQERKTADVADKPNKPGISPR